MNYNITPIQRDFYLECLLDPSANKKFNINMIFTLNIKSYKSQQDILDAIYNTIINQPLLLSIPSIEHSNISLNTSNKFDITEIEIGRTVTKLEDDEIFYHPFDLMNDKRLFKLKLIKYNPYKYYLLMSAHHFIFDFYSAQTFTQQIIDTLSGEAKFSQEDFIQAFSSTNQKFLEKQNSPKYEEIFANRLSKIIVTDEKIFKNFTNFQKFEINKKVKIDQSYNNNYRSALLISAFGYTYCRIINKSHIIIGVPVPNRVKSNRNLISSLVTTYPVVICKKWSIDECRQFVYQQLTENLKMQFYDFNSKFSQYSKFDMMFTYYSSDFTISNSGAEIKLKKLFTINSPSPIHLMLNDDNLLLAEFQTDKIENKNTFFEKSLHYL